MGYVSRSTKTVSQPPHPEITNDTVLQASSSLHLRHSKSPQSDGATATHQVGDLGRSLLTTLQSNSRAVNSVPEHQEQNRKTQEEEDEESQITGSDILWALQKASARRKKKQKKRAASSGGSSRQEGPVDYSNVRPLNVKKAWGSKLDALEKRLQELSETI